MIVNIRGTGPGAAHAAPKAKPAAVARSAAPQELFDANGDGALENWSVLHGGDSFATLSPPPTGSGPAPPRRGGDGAPGPAPNHTAAVIHHAHDAYRRDGLARSPAQPVVLHTPPAPAGPMPQPAGRAPLPSSA